MCYGPEFIAQAVRDWLGRIGMKTLYIAPSSPWENGYCESFNGSLRDERRDDEIFYTLAEAKVLIEARRRHYNSVRPQSSLGYRPPAPGAAAPPFSISGSAWLHLRPAMAVETPVFSLSSRTSRCGLLRAPPVRLPMPGRPSVPSARDAGACRPSADTRPPANRSAPRGW
jgi:putative transposase